MLGTSEMKLFVLYVTLSIITKACIEKTFYFVYDMGLGNLLPSSGIQVYRLLLYTQS